MRLANRLLLRLDRVLELGERILGELTRPAVSPELFSRHSAFRWQSDRGRGRLVPILSPAEFDLDDLRGVEHSVAALDRNTRQLLAGLPCNNVLLFGERGTGKSSAVRGLLTRYASEGLRLVEVERGELRNLTGILASLRLADPSTYRFLIFCDDLSFGLGEMGYRELKAALEGSLERRPENICIVATSNRRHLIPETMAENRDARLDEHGELHLGESLEEKLALAERFGLTLGFYSFNQKVYLEIVAHYLDQSGLGELSEPVREEALRWALTRGSRSGRVARQFVDDLAGRTQLDELP